MKLIAIAIDEEPPALSIITEFASQGGFIDLRKTFTKPMKAIRHLKYFPVDLVILDIDMSSMSGLKFFKKIPGNAQVIFTSAHAEYAIEGFNLKVADYLLKPFSYKRFSQAIEKVKQMAELMRSSEDKGVSHLFIRAGYSLIKVNFTDIAYIQGLDDYIKIHLDTGNMILARMSLKKMMERLPPSAFCRMHRSFIVPLQKIQSVRNKQVCLANVQIQLGAHYTNEFYAVYKP